MINFIFSKVFLKQLLYAAVFVVVVTGGFYLYLSIYTSHGDAIEVPDVRGRAADEVAIEMDDLGFKAVVIDSVYAESGEGGFVFDQSPIPGSKVKEGRSVYLTVFRKTPPAENLGVKEGMIERVAGIVLTNKGIKYEVQYEENHLLAGMVIRVMYRGKKLKPDSQIKKGEKVVLIVGESSEGRVVVPRLKGLTLAEAENLLTTSKLTMGSVLFDDDVLSAADSALAKVYAQSPSSAGEEVQAGSLVDLYLGFRAITDSINP